MTVQSLKIGKGEFVLVPKREFERLAARARKQAEQEARDAGDVTESRRRMKEPGGSTSAQVRARLGR
jgi:hypothetical protein